MNDAVIVSAVRTAVGKAPKGTLRNTRPDEMGGAVIREALARVPGLDPSEIEDVIMGCAMPEAEQGMNVARAAAIRAGLPVETSAMTINRFCSSGLQSIAIAADRIRTGSAEVAVAGGLETMSMIPMGGHIIRPNPYLVEHYPDFYLNMGLATENVARKYNVSREEQDEFALRSHQRAAAALDADKFKEETVPLTVTIEELDAKGRKQSREVVFDADEGVRRDSTIEGLAKLKPAFNVKGTITAGNASQMSDGAAAAVVMSAEKAQSLGVKALARFVAYATAGCPPEEMGIGPVFAIPRVLKLAGLTLDDIDVIELNEAFAAQSLAVIKTLGLDIDKVNVNGGAIALGHPLGCTGAKLTASILRELERRGGRYGMVTMCVGGGMGAAGILNGSFEMTASEIFEAVTGSGSTDFATLVAILNRRGAWCLIGGLAVNCYVEPVYTLDADIVVAASELSAIKDDLIHAGFLVEEFPHSLNAMMPKSDLRIQFTLDSRYQDFVNDTKVNEVLGQQVPVASLENIVAGKIWAWSDEKRRLSERKKDELDLIRIAEAYPDFREVMPGEIRQQLEHSRFSVPIS